MIDNPLNRLKARRGRDITHAILTEEDARMIRQIADDREVVRAQLKAMTNRALAEKFDVHRRTIERLLAGETWGHI